jgi:hypothetical protein
MMLFPALTTAVGYTTNVYGQSTGAVGDGYTTIKPEFALISQWSRNFFEITGSGDFKRYFSQSVRNETGYSVQADGRIDLGTDDNIIALVHRARAFEEQYSGSFPQNSAGAVGYDQTDATLRGTFEFNRLRVIASGRVNDLVYSNTFTLTNQLPSGWNIPSIPISRCSPRAPIFARITTSPRRSSRCATTMRRGSWPAAISTSASSFAAPSASVMKSINTI